MKNGRSRILAFIVPAFVTSGCAQKVEVGCDKSTDFSKYTTNSWAKPQTPVIYSTREHS
jgi:hypothetical protein